MAKGRAEAVERSWGGPGKVAERAQQFAPKCEEKKAVIYQGIEGSYNCMAHEGSDELRDMSLEQPSGGSIQGREGKAVTSEK